MKKIGQRGKLLISTMFFILLIFELTTRYLGQCDSVLVLEEDEEQQQYSLLTTMCIFVYIFSYLYISAMVYRVKLVCSK